MEQPRMKIKTEFQLKTRQSKLWNILRVFFPGVEMREVWLTFGRTIWTPGMITEDLITHEQVHVIQQGNWRKAILWWIKYIRDKEFRYSQELPAYRAQLRYLKRAYPDRNQGSKIRMDIARIMAGEKYKNMVSYQKAFDDLYYYKS